MVAKCVPPAEIFKEVLEEWSHGAGSGSKGEGRSKGRPPFVSLKGEGQDG